MAQYDLEDVKAAARNMNIQYRGPKLYIHIAELGYSLKDVADCILQLTDYDFEKSISYSNACIDDAYITYFTNTASEREHKLYVKFSLIDGCLDIDLGSFHIADF